MKRFFRIIGLSGLGFLLWYFGIKTSDYNIHFKAKTSTGHAYSELINWGAVTQLPSASAIKQKEPYQDLVQELQMGDKVVEVNWSFSRLNDSVTSISAGLKDPHNRFFNRLLIPFKKTSFEEKTLELVLDYKTFLEESLKQFTISIEEETTGPEHFCACIRSKTSPEKKAFSMMRDYSYLSGFITSSGLEPQGRPLIEVIAFDENKRMLEFDFCFPIVRSDNLPESPDIFFKEIKGRPSIKATYHGDYRFSEKSWYRLFEHAEDQHLNYMKNPIEIYHNNPNMGGDALKWTTTIYLPINKS